MLEAITLTLFSLANFIRAAAFVPQIIHAGRDENGATAISNASWVMFGFSHLATALYAVVNLKDMAMALAFGVNTLACALIIAATIRSRRRYYARITLEQREEEPVPKDRDMCVKIKRVA